MYNSLTLYNSGLNSLTMNGNEMDFENYFIMFVFFFFFFLSSKTVARGITNAEGET